PMDRPIRWMILPAPRFTAMGPGGRSRSNDSRRRRNQNYAKRTQNYAKHKTFVLLDMAKQRTRRHTTNPVADHLSMTAEELRPRRARLGVLLRASSAGRR